MAKSTHTQPEVKEVKKTSAETAKLIKEKAKSSDQFEYDDPQEAKDIFSKLPEGEFVIKEGEKAVIQKL